MRYRKLDENYDMCFGRGAGDYFRNEPEMVAQNILTRLRLFTREWFLDAAEGTPYREQVLGKYTEKTWANALKRRIIQTRGVLSLDAFDAFLDSETRTCTVNAEVTTIYGRQVIQDAILETIPMYGV
ncbi:hypothetical protein FACS1894216_01260 [Synergistales bacterium]|nr:hypothetical protein FACS1894216_01260 [Synergistales bacterium]